MKKFFSGIFLILMLTCCAVFYGCGEKYAGLSLSIGLSYSKNAETTEQLENGDYRVTTNSGVFDDHLDGSYTFYIKEGVNTSATLNAKFSNAPDDFNYGISFSLSNEILSVNKNLNYVSNGVNTTITAFEPGTTVLTVYSNEGSKKSSIVINVVELATSISFKTNNLGMVNESGSLLTLENNSTIKLNTPSASITSIKYNFGLLEKGSFKKFEDLTEAGFNFNAYTNSLRLLKTVSYESFYIQAIYENPLGEDLEALTEVSLVNKINNFQLYYGSNKEHVIEKNLIDVNDIDDIAKLIINIENLNYIDVILHVNSNQEFVKFNYLVDSNLPVYFLENKEQEYLAEGNYYVDSYDKATYTNYYFKIIALKKTTENDNYVNGEYNLKFSCDYANYTVNGYPLIESMIVKNDTLIKNFSVNGETIEKFDGTVKEDNHYKGEIYINNDEGTLGTEFEINVANPVQISNENSAFKISVLDSSLNVVKEFYNYFDISFKTSKNADIFQVGNLNNVFYKGTSFYIKPKTNKVQQGDIYYLLITAELPEGDGAQALVKLNVVQGISEFTGFSYKLVEEEIQETESQTDNDTNNGVAFDKTNLIANQTLFLDYTSLNKLLEVDLSFEPDGASTRNIIITSADERVAKVILKQKNNNGQDNDYDIFKIKGVSIGETEIYITTTNINKVYTIPVNVYQPINSFDVNFVNISPNSSGVGRYYKDEQSKTINAVVEIERQINLVLNTLPNNASQYNIKYSVYHTEITEDNLVGSYSVDYLGNSSDKLSLISNAEFYLDCKGNYFKFTDKCPAGKQYIVQITLTNLDQKKITYTINLSSYVRIDHVKVEVTNNNLYNPNTIAYSYKNLGENDPTIFGIKIDTIPAYYGTDKSVAPTYTFEEYGNIYFYASEKIISYSLQNGVLVKEKSNEWFEPIYTFAVNGYYWFKLNEKAKTFSNISSSIIVMAEVEELGDITFNESIQATVNSCVEYETIRINNAELVSNLTTSNLEQIYFKQGITSQQEIDIFVQKDTSYNKNLLYKTYDILEINEDLYYIEASKENAVIDLYTEQTVVKENQAGQEDEEDIKNIIVENKDGKHNLKVTAKKQGLSVIVIMPEDKLITQEDYNKWYEKEYVEIGKISEELYNEYKSDLYINSQSQYVTTEQFIANESYFIYASTLQGVNSLWGSNYLAFYVTVADGVKVPYQISTVADFEEIALTTDSISKKYVLTEDLYFDTNKPYQPIGNYYQTERQSEGVYYILNNGVYQDGENILGAVTYYARGFNGHFNGKYSYTDIKTGKKVETQHKISGLSYAGEYNLKNAFGLFETIGISQVNEDGITVENVILNYERFQPKLSNNLIFGGIAGINYGTIKNCQVNFKNFVVDSKNRTVIGGVTGVNYNTINNDKISGLTGNINYIVSDNSVETIIGGFVGKNEGTLSGTYTNEIDENTEFLFNNAGFDSSLNIKVTTNNNSATLNSKIGGAVGQNIGLVENLAIQGNINALNCNNVGGLVGEALYNEIFNKEDAYSIGNAYSIAKIKGNNNVGGAVGNVDGSSNKKINVFNISAENYVKSQSDVRAFVEGNNNVGGLIGSAKYLNIEYSYVVSYFEGEYNNEDTSNFFDIIAKEVSAGFIANLNNVDIDYCASNVNVKSDSSAFAFAGNTDDKSSASNIFAICTINKKQDGVEPLGFVFSSLGGYYNYYVIKNLENNQELLSSNITRNQDGDFITTLSADAQKNNWAKNSNVNKGLPYILINNQPLFATTPIIVSAIVNEISENEDYESYIKYDKNNNSVILFFNKETTNYNYNLSQIALLNILKIKDFATLSVIMRTSKTIRLNLISDNIKVIDINADGSLKIMGEGKAKITISSKLNTKFKTEIYIVVKYGVTNVELYQNAVYTEKVDEDTKIEILKTENKTLYVKTEYIRDLLSYTNAELKNTSEIGFRFYVDSSSSGAGSLNDVLNGLDIGGIDNLFKMNGLPWLYDGSKYYVDISHGIFPTITPINAMENNKYLKVYYIPFIKTKFDVLENVVLLDKFSGSFDLSIIKGATQIIIENNVDYEVSQNNNIKTYKTSISQLQTHSFTVTLFTDYELDDIVDNTASQNINNLLTIVRSDIVRKYNDEDKSLLESISITYTINYKNKMEAVEKDLNYLFEFIAASNATIKFNLSFTIVGQDKINQVYGSFYSNLTDFPQKPTTDNIIYNATPGVLSVEVYPYISNYSKMRLYYRTTSIHPVFITQLSYNITGQGGDKLTDYPDSGFITDANDVLTINKSSGQDTYLLNDLGTYSYSKIYFFSLLVATEVPDETKYSVYVEFLNRNGDIIETHIFDFTSIALPSANFEFDESLKSDEGIYYLPINTTNEMIVNTVNYDGEISWSIELVSNGVDNLVLNQNMIETLLPKQIDKGKYQLTVLRYSNSNPEVNVFTEDLIGRKLRLTASITDKDRTYTFSKEIIVTLFTVKDVLLQNTSQGYMTLPLYTVSPLMVSLDVYCDESLLNTNDNWYSTWYDNFSNTNTNRLNQYITASGYEIEQTFSNYFIQLANSISKAKFSTSNSNMSGVWFNNTKLQSGYIQNNHDYNSSTFSVEMYNEYFAVYGMQIDTNTEMSFKLKLSYSNVDKQNKKVEGIPNVKDYDISSTNTNYKGVFNINKDFILNFTYKSDLINAIPISTAEEFMSMQQGLDYRLVNDIVLNNYTPLNTKISTLDGNNYTIYITSFAEEVISSQSCTLGLFDTIDTDTILYNVTVNYTNSVSYINEQIIPSAAGLSQSITKASRVVFGGIAGTNKGTLTNCKVSGKISLVLNVDSSQGTIANALNGGLVANNSETGYITNCKVISFEMNCYGLTGGFVGENYGKIISSYFDDSIINNLSSNNTGGFVYINSGDINECFVQGKRNETDNDIRNTGTGISAKGVVGGFVHTSQGNISDCYSNISLSSSTYIAGFVYQDSETSVISRSYSISYKSSSDNSTVAGAFAGANSANYTKITINGTLNNCYFLKVSGSWSNLVWESSLQTKQAKGLDFDEFATHTNFVNFDLSLVYNRGSYANGEIYSYVDGYVWVIIDGKPVIVSTLIDTISQRAYAGKNKHYSEVIEFFSDEDIDNTSPIRTGNKIRTNYYDSTFYNGEYKEEDLVFYTIEDTNKKTLTYYFKGNGEIEDITLIYSISYKADGKTINTKEIVEAYCGKENSKVLDIVTVDENNNIISKDNNYRANDTIQIIYDEDDNISAINYRVLESAEYHYNSNVYNVSDVVGSRTNPQIIYDYESFVHYTYANTSGKFFRVIKDIDFNYQFATTAYVDFQGVIQGNYMEFDNISLSYLNKIPTSNQTNSNQNKDSFGLFAGIKTSQYGINTMISNLKLNIVEVLSNSHKFVGGLAGEITASNNNSAKIIINNITINGIESRSAYIQGKNAVGGLAGIATGSVMLKDIFVSANINATKEISNGEENVMLYISKNRDENLYNSSIAKISYAGGVIGILDCKGIEDASTQKNYNVNNVSVTGDVGVIGGIVGSVFGLVGPETVVNYINTVLSATERNYLMATAYAGGLVGENRGTIISSSITYGEADTNSSVKIGESSFIANDYFRPLSAYVIGIGGIVGFNNGGTISNTITTIDVRSKKALLAGGAVGRAAGGLLENVVATGSVVAEFIVGGFIGTINDREILINNRYNTNALYNLAQGSKDVVKIKGCISANNWQLKDYSYYKHLLNTDNVVAGFVGIIAVFSDAGITDVSQYSKMIDFCDKYSYFTNTVYTATAGSPELYLRPGYSGGSLDTTPSNIESSSIYAFGTVNASNDINQMLYPYSISQMYYEDTEIASYVLESRKNTSTVAGKQERIYKLLNLSTNIESIDLFNQISDLIKNNNNFTQLKDLYGTIYYKDGSNYEEITSDTELEKHSKAYYINKNKAQKFTISKIYGDKYDDEIVLFKDGHTTSSLANFKNIKNIYINGIKFNITINNDTQIELLDSNRATLPTKFSGVSDLNNGEILVLNLTVDVILPNTIKAKNLKVYISKISEPTGNGGVTYSFAVNEIKVFYDYQVSSAGNEYANYITNDLLLGTNYEERFTLNLSSKKVIYYDLLNNGYWRIGENFLLNANHSDSNKYLQNVEYASTYIWSNFADEGLNTSNNVIEINNAEQFAQLANVINSGTLNTSGKTISLANDIDLSGKYWVPIGTQSKPFKGIFDGNSYSIKYATINEKSNGNQIVKYAGIFGYVENATIQNVNLLGGDSVGLYSGGLVGASKGNTTIQNITNRNNVTGYIYAGGILGCQTGSTSSVLTITNCENRGTVSHNNYENTIDNVYAFGGIAGHIDNVKTINNVNHAEINIVNTKTSYAKANAKYRVYVGGLFGRISSNFTNYDGKNNSNFNYGKINVVANADSLYVGGVIGACGESFNNVDISHLKNYSNIEVTSLNIFNAGDEKAYSKAYIGGVIGATPRSVILCGNEGKVLFNLNITADCFVCVGGVLGRLGENYQENINQCYNTGTVEANAISEKTNLGLGGICGVVECTSADGSDVQSKNITNCYNTGDVKTNSNSTSFVGGILGLSAQVNTIQDPNEPANKQYLVIGTFEGESGVVTEYNKYVNVGNNLNIGVVNITNINSLRNALGAIVGYAGTKGFTRVVHNSDEETNLYLRDSAYSGTEIYNGYCEFLEEDDSSGILEGKFVSTENEKGSKGYLSSNLKEIKAYPTFDFVNKIWGQKYSTWYPTLTNNISSSMWIDKQEELSQEKGNFIVKSAEELAYIANMINTGSIDSKNITIRLVDFIDLSNRYWTPIGTAENPFKGTFDGNGYVIKNLTVNGDYLEDNNYGGLFGVCEKATIKNIGLESALVMNVNYAGAFVASATNCQLYYVYTDSALTTAEYENSDDSITPKISANIIAGGLVGIANNCTPNEESNFKGGIYYSYNNNKVELAIKIVDESGNQIDNTFVEGVSSVGGLVGNINNTLISNSYNNSKGYISTLSTKPHEGLFIVDNIDNEKDLLGESQLINVFNLCVTFNGIGQIDPVLYEISEELDLDGNIINKATPIEIESEQGLVLLEPSYENLAENMPQDVKAGDIWTKEYTLNKQDDGENDINYPSIRGLGQEWKNIESEAIVSFSQEDIHGDEDVEQTKSRTRFEEYLLKNDFVDLIKNKDGEDVLNWEGVSNFDPKLVVYDYVVSQIAQTTKKKYYFITSAEELAWVAINVNNGGLITNNCEFILLKDIDLSGKYWTPIGASSVYPFQGTFNFNGHTIKGLTIDSNSLTYAGLFGYTKNAGIVNGYLYDSFIKITNLDDKTNIYAGSLVGKAYNTTIQNMSIKTAVAGFANASVFVGGLVGHISGSLNYEVSNIRINPVIETVKADDNVTEVNQSRYIDLGKYSDNVLEELDAGNDINQEKINEKSINIGAFSEGGNVYAGGIAGYISGYVRKNEDEKEAYLVETVTNNCNIAAICISDWANVFSGGIIGYAHEQVNLFNARNNANIKTYTRQEDMVGGIVGYMNDGSINNAQFSGYMESSQDFTNHIVSRIGGIVGYMTSGGEVFNCYNNGSIPTNSQYAKSAAIGGIIGYSVDRYIDYSTSNNWVVSASGFNVDDITGNGYIGFSSTGVNYKDVKLSNSATYLTNFNNTGIVIWSVTGGLKSTAIRLVGCGTSFAYGEGDNKVGLSTGNGVLAYDINNIILTSDSGTFEEKSKIYVSIGSREGDIITPLVIREEIKTTSNLNLHQNVLNGKNYDGDSAIVCFISYVLQDSLDE